MTKKYDLKFPAVIKKIIDLYNEIDPLGKHGTASGHLKPIIYIEINRILDFLENEKKNNKTLVKLLETQDYKGILQILEKGVRY